MKNNPAFKMAKSCSRMANRALKNVGSSKNNEHFFNYIQYTREDLVKHLESQFDENMTWDNHGSYWHIDHIIPQSELPYFYVWEPNFIICWSLNNLRPLPAHQNCSEGSTRIRHKLYKKDPEFFKKLYGIVEFDNYENIANTIRLEQKRIETKKICAYCNEEKDKNEENFRLVVKSKQRDAHLNSMCRPCEKITRKIYRENNKEKITEYRIKNRLKIK